MMYKRMMAEIRALTDRIYRLECELKTMSYEMHNDSKARIDYIAVCDYPEMIEDEEGEADE